MAPLAHAVRLASAPSLSLYVLISHLCRAGGDGTIGFWDKDARIRLKSMRRFHFSEFSSSH
jgi:hypothetical protein